MGVLRGWWCPGLLVILKNDYMKVLIGVVVSLLFFGCAKVDVFQEPPDYPVIDSLAPASGRIGTQIRLYGSGFSTQAGLDTVTVNGVTVQVVAATSTVVLATVTSNTGTGHVGIHVGGKQAAGPIFTYDQGAVSLNSLTPASGWVDTVVTLRGVGFGTVQDSVTVSFNGQPAVIRRLSDTLIVVLAPAAADNNGTGGAVTVTVTVRGRVSNGLPFTYTRSQPQPPVITAILCDVERFSHFAGGDTLYLYGQHFGSQLPGYDVEIWSADSTTHYMPNPAVLSWTDTLIRVVIPTAGYTITTGATVSLYVREGALFAKAPVYYVGGNGGPVLDTLSVARGNLAAAGVGNFILFAGGSYHGSNNITTYYNTVDLYNTSTQTWSTSKLSVARNNLAGAATGNKILFAGGQTQSGMDSTVDIYDIGNGGWTTSHLSEPREIPTGASAGNIAIFAGGIGQYIASNTADIYDVNAGTWTTYHFSVSGYYLAGAGTGSKIAFAGFTNGSTPLTTVEIYDISTATWTTAQLSQARTNIAAAAAGSKIFFAGGKLASGVPTNVVDIFDVNSGTWTTSQLSQARSSMGAAAVGSKMLFAGGTLVYGTNTATMDIYDVSSGVWTSTLLSTGAYLPPGAGAGSTIIFDVGGATGNVVNIFGF